jgi:hypothetical protein
MNIQIGKYKRPGIFIEEFDNSAFEVPVVEGTSTMVIGVSKKGPINNPVLLNNTNDLERVFGPLDRNLEKKASYFHRTITKMLETGPVSAMNLLATDDTLDRLQYKSLSTSVSHINDSLRDNSYRLFFDTTGFWERDTDAFLNAVDLNNAPGEDTRILNLTNMSDRNITAFIYKTKRTGFDVSMLEWYGSSDKVPTYVYETDYVSDYMVDILVVSGDWSNYQTLSIDNKWGKYFSTSGLRKDQVINFANDRNINRLAYYEGVSLIPYFQDQNGSNIFIETIVNKDTDKTGLYCSLDISKLETDYPMGYLDLIGNDLIDNNKSSVEFLSYKDDVSENITFPNVKLDTVGNVTSIITSTTSTLRNTSTYENRTANYAEGYVSNLVLSRATTVAGTTSNPGTVSVTFLASSGAYAVINNSEIDISAGTYSLAFNVREFSLTASVRYYGAAYVVANDGTLKYYNTTTGGTSSTSITYPSVSTSDIVLGYATFSVAGRSVTGITYNNVTVGTNGYVELTVGNNTKDLTISTSGSNVTFVYNGTNIAPATKDYAVYRRYKSFNRFVSILDTPNITKIAAVDNSGNKYYGAVSLLANSVLTSNSVNKQFTIVTTGMTSSLTDITSGNFIFYTLDNEFIVGESGTKTKTTYPDLNDLGAMGPESDFYKKFVDGVINTRDYFYQNILPDTYTVSFDTDSGSNYLTFYNGPTASLSTIFNDNDKVMLPSSTLNSGELTILDSTPVILFGTSSISFEVNEVVTSEILTSVNTLWRTNDKFYLKLTTDTTGVVEAVFTDDTISVTQSISDITLNTAITVFSQRSNHKQTIEVERPSGYTQSNNKILVIGSRYTEIKLGDFLLADYDVNSLQPGEVPKKLARITSKKVWSGDSTYVEITCDRNIKIETIGGDYQTYRFTKFDDYVNTYKAITMSGFKVRTASLPDGSETRQNTILNILAKGTNLFKTLTNKDIISFRYVVDSFGLGLTERSKQQLVDICGERRDVIGFINMPSMKQFKNSSSPSFVDEDGIVSTTHIATGGNLEDNPAFLYSFGDGDGSSCVGYFTPYVGVNDNGRPIDVPPAMFVGSTYMKKINSNQTNIKPWTIAAGITNGQVTGIASLEKSFTSEDIENLNGMGANPIIFRRNRGFVIETENTAQRSVKSALSYLHVREVLIELEKELADMLLNFQWKFNTPDVRGEIKLRADTICARYVNDDGLFNHFNKIDEENNTPDVIDNQMGILETFVEPIKGMGVIVNSITILRTNAIASGGFGL